MTTAVYTVDYTALVEFQPGMIGLLVARNVVLALFVAIVVAELWSGGVQTADPADGPRAWSRARAASAREAMIRSSPGA
jgi:hypothetical protein